MHRQGSTCFLAFYCTCSWEGERRVCCFCSSLSPSCLHLAQASGLRPRVRKHHLATQGVKSEWFPPTSSTVLQPNRTSPTHLPPREDPDTPRDKRAFSPDFRSPPPLSQCLLSPHAVCTISYKSAWLTVSCTLELTLLKHIAYSFFNLILLICFCSLFSFFLIHTICCQK